MASSNSSKILHNFTYLSKSGKVDINNGNIFYKELRFKNIFSFIEYVKFTDLKHDVRESYDKWLAIR